MQQPVSTSANITITGMAESHIDVAEKTLIQPGDLLDKLGYKNEFEVLLKILPTLVNDGVQNSPEGVIVQDPAGSAVGSPYLSGGGGSGAIYAHFHDLKPIPKINPGESVFNESEDAGSRVLHSYSPHIGHPLVPPPAPLVLADFELALTDLADSYFNAFTAVKLLPPEPGNPGTFTAFGAVPLAGRIFARNFKNTRLNHLHPGITIISILVAQAEMVRAKKTMPPVSIYYYDDAVFKVAQTVMTTVSNELRHTGS